MAQNPGKVQFFIGNLSWPTFQNALLKLQRIRKVSFGGISTTFFCFFSPNNHRTLNLYVCKVHWTFQGVVKSCWNMLWIEFVDLLVWKSLLKKSNQNDGECTEFWATFPFKLIKSPLRKRFVIMGIPPTFPVKL